MKMEQSTDAQLVQWSLSGDSRAFEEIVRRNLSSVSAVAYALTGDRCVSDDVTQETFLSAWQRLRDLREPEKLRSWLCVIAQNVANTFGRKRARDPIRAACNLEAAIEVESATPSPADKAIVAEQQRLVWSAIEHIPESYRVPLVLFYREGQSVAQVGNALDLSDEAVRQRLSRARAMLKGQVADMVEGFTTASRPGPLLVTAIMASVASGTLNAAAATTVLIASSKMGTGATGITAAASGGAAGAAVGPVVGFAGGLFGLLTCYRSAESPAERRLVLRFMIITFAVSLLCPLFMMVAFGFMTSGWLSPSLALLATVGAIITTFCMVGVLARRFTARYKSLLLANEQTLTEVQAWRLKSMRASPHGWVSPDEVAARVKRRPFLTATAFHGGVAFPGLGWIMADGVHRNDDMLFYSALMAAIVVEATAIRFTMRRPRNYLFHFSMKLFAVVALMSCTLLYWQFSGIMNAFGAKPAESWFLMRVLPAGLATGYLIGALAMLAGFRGQNDSDT